MSDTTQTIPRRRHFRRPLRHWLSVWRSRRALARLEPHLLRDIGVSDFRARAEAARRLRDAPDPWKGPR